MDNLPLENTRVSPPITPEHFSMTNSMGCPIANDKNSLTVGANGPVLLEDVTVIDKMAHFDRERANSAWTKNELESSSTTTGSAIKA